MMQRALRLVIGLVVLAALSLQAQTIPTPAEFVGHPIGADKKLVRWEKIVEYFQLVDRASDRVLVEELGKTTLGNPFILAIISAPGNLQRLEELKKIQRQLAYPYELDEAAAEQLIARGKPVLLITCSIHASEIGANQMSLELLHRLATEDSPFIKNILDNVVFLLVPSFNPDGQIMVVDWYNKNVDTEYEPSSMPWLYHHYVGHDNNRDAFMLTQVESRLVTKLLYQDWFPQVYLDEHQMGAQGARIFVPPFMDPINPNVDSVIWAENNLLGFAMNAALHEKGLTGVTYGQMYTGWWRGAFLMEAWWHNIVGLLTEVASARVATPLEQEKTEPGVPARRPEMDFEEFMRAMERDPSKPIPAPQDTIARANYPRPWLGGTWRLRDIVDYDQVAAFGLLDAVANHGVTLMKNHYLRGRRAIEQGKKGNPYAYVFPPAQHDPGALAELLEVMHFAGVEVHQAEQAFTADGKEYPAGSYVILLAQPFRAYVKDLLEVQKYPDVRQMPPGTMRERPYDVTGWTLPLQMSVKSVEVKKPFEAKLTKLAAIPAAPGKFVPAEARRRAPYGYLIRPEPNNKVIATNRLLKAGAEVYWLTEEVTLDTTTYPVGTLLVRGQNLGTQVETLAKELGLVAAAVVQPVSAKALRLRAPRVGLYQPWTGSMDEGWTRWLLEHYEVLYTTLRNDDIKAGKLGQQFDVIIFPGDRNKRAIVEGDQRKWTRAEYKGGIGEEGVEALREFVRAGGTLLLLDSSTELGLETMVLPVKNVLKGVRGEQFACPGSLLRILADNRHPIAYGMPAEASAVFLNSPAFDLAPGFSYTDVRVIARYPSTNPLQSGWIRGPEYLQDRIAAAEVTYEKGRVVLLGFRAQFRAQPHGTFKLLFNTLHYAAATEATLPRR